MLKTSHLERGTTKPVRRVPVRCGAPLFWLGKRKEKPMPCRFARAGCRKRCEVNNEERCGRTRIASSRYSLQCRSTCVVLLSACACAVAGLATLHGSKNLFTKYNQPVADVWVLLVMVVVVAVVVIGGVFLVRHACANSHHNRPGCLFFHWRVRRGGRSFLSWYLPTWYE